MPKSHRPYAPEFRRQMVVLVRSGRQADRDEGRRQEGPTTNGDISQNSFRIAFPLSSGSQWIKSDGRMLPWAHRGFRSVPCHSQVSKR